MSSFRTDTSQWPIVVHTSEGAMGPDQMLAFIDGCNSCLLRKSRYYTVFDSSRLSTFRMPDRDRIVAWLKDNDAQIRRYSVGTSVVLSSATLRFVISSVLLVYKPAAPIKVWATLEEAMAYARQQVLADNAKSAAPAASAAH